MAKRQRKMRVKVALNSQADIPPIRFNESAGADKVVMVKPAVLRPTAANENVGQGAYIMIQAATSYDLAMIGRAYDATITYNEGDMVTNGGFVWIAQATTTGTFDQTKWLKVCPDTITGIPTQAGEIVTTGRYHNSISVAGFLVDDDSTISQ